MKKLAQVRNNPILGDLLDGRVAENGTIRSGSQLANTYSGGL